ncbi:hypothetical protein, partial [Marinobacter sp. NFXS9]|uniref:hypothetical protein n=1 Tax=Marinobacter sp. NFXS9 TaxID=2818433 RepID=UPI0032DFF8BC
PVGSWGFLPVFGRNGEIYDGYYTPKSGQLIAFVQVFTFAGATFYLLGVGTSNFPFRSAICEWLVVGRLSDGCPGDIGAQIFDVCADLALESGGGLTAYVCNRYDRCVVFKDTEVDHFGKTAGWIGAI